MMHTSLIEALQSVKSDDKEIVFINSSDDEQRITFAQLYTRALGLLNVLQNRGVQQGAELIIYINNNQFFLDAFWACILGGIVPVPVAIGISDEHRAKLIRIINKLTNPYLYTEQDQFQRLSEFLKDNSSKISARELHAKTLLADDIHDISLPGTIADMPLDSTAFIQFSSGSTSDPKGVVLTHRNLLTNIRAIGERDRLTGNDIALSWMPLTHDMGLIGFHLSFLLHHASHCIMPAQLFSRRPVLWLIKAARHRATVLNSPNFGYKHVLRAYQAQKMTGIDLSCVRMIYNGAEPISVSLYEEFLDTMAEYGLKRTVMHTVYGLAEASLAVAMPYPEQLPQHVVIDRHSIKLGDKVQFVDKSHIDVVTFAVEGPPVKDCSISIVDESNIVLDNDTVGQILIKGDNVTKGYYLDEQTNKALISPDGWLATGDVGFMHDGQLVVTGRIKDIIFVNGQNYFPFDIEAIIHQQEQLELGKVVAAGVTQDVAANNELLIFVLHRGPLNEFVPQIKSIRRAVNENMGLEVAHVIPVARIPKTTSGKIQRHLLVEMYLQGEFDQQLSELESIIAATEIVEPDVGMTATEQQLLMLCNNVMEGKSLGIHDNLFETGISSLVLSEIHQEIEDSFPNKVDIVDLFDYQSIAELARYIDSKQE